MIDASITLARHLRFDFPPRSSIAVLLPPQSMPLPPANDPIVEAIAARVRHVVARQRSRDLAATAQVLGVATEDFRRLIDEDSHAIDAAFLVDVIAALTHHSGIDPRWLLSGDYDGSTHRMALLLGEDQTENGRRALRSFVGEHYQRLRDGVWSL